MSDGDGSGGAAGGSGGDSASGGNIGSGSAPPATGGSNSGGSEASSGGLGAMGGLGGGSADEALFVPEGLSNTEEGGTGGGLDLIAFSLIEGPAGLELYAAIQNVGDTVLCDATMLTTFVDHEGQVPAVVVSGIYTSRVYRFYGGTGPAVRCIDPGDTVMAATIDLPDEVVLSEIDFLVHEFPYFYMQDIVPVVGVSLQDVLAVPAGAGATYTGSVENGLDISLTSATVDVFPVNSVGRPLGITTIATAEEIPAGESWSFETPAVTDAGSDFMAFVAYGAVF